MLSWLLMLTLAVMIENFLLEILLKGRLTQMKYILLSIFSLAADHLGHTLISRYYCKINAFSFSATLLALLQTFFFILFYIVENFVSGNRCCWKYFLFMCSCSYSKKYQTLFLFLSCTKTQVNTRVHSSAANVTLNLQILPQSVRALILNSNVWATSIQSVQLKGLTSRES